MAFVLFAWGKTPIDYIWPGGFTTYCIAMERFNTTRRLDSHFTFFLHLGKRRFCFCLGLSWIVFLDTNRYKTLLEMEHGGIDWKEKV